LLPLSHDLSRYLFFFQAEDGIRDATVTGVQTCALPIFDLDPRWVVMLHPAFLDQLHDPSGIEVDAQADSAAELGQVLDRQPQSRSEERRVGKECRAQRAREQ